MKKIAEKKEVVEKKQKTASTNAASASKPKMVKKPTFSAKQPRLDIRDWRKSVGGKVIP
ncbi:hypothetical protein JCM19241_551 [Vibrio ishigakensis]|uniref:Uncharacterized protein n=1 Tax=Vibrio ishigakensis TaxID=1481914 RepID=A0A0B8QMK2_9VIBR|nr:hypothetical protein JCM19241_551 [Vibrio ishigakensis]